MSTSRLPWAHIMGGRIVPVAAPAHNFKDTFVEGSPPVSLLSHTPDIGTNWTRLSGSTSIWTVNPTGNCTLTTKNNTAVGHTNQNCYLANGTALASADYTVTGAFKVNSQAANGVHIYGRFVDSTHYYQVVWYWWAPELDLLDGAANLLGTTASGVSGANGSTHTIDLVMTGTTIAVKFDGVQKISVTNAHEASAGQGAIGHEGNVDESTSVGVAFTSFQVN